MVGMAILKELPIKGPIKDVISTAIKIFFSSVIGISFN